MQYPTSQPSLSVSANGTSSFSLFTELLSVDWSGIFPPKILDFLLDPRDSTLVHSHSHSKLQGVPWELSKTKRLLLSTQSIL